MKTIFFIFIVAVSTVASQLLLKKGVMTLDLSRFSFGLVLSVITSPFIIASVMIQLSSFVLWLLIISRFNLGLAFGFAGAFLYLIIPFSSWLMYGERLTLLQWVGLCLITAGIFFITRGNIPG